MASFVNVHENPDEKFDIVFEAHPEISPEDIPLLDKELYTAVESVTIVIKNLHGTSTKIKEKYFKKLLSLAQTGSVGLNSNPELALSSLNLLKEEMLSIEGHRIKNKYMGKLGTGALFGIILCWIVYLIISSIYPTFDISYFYVWTGAMIGTWISFGARKFSIKFEELSVMEEDKMSIVIRLPYVGICSLIFLLFLNSGIIKLELGNLPLDLSNAKIEFLLILGILSGLLESKLGTKIYAKAESLTSSL